MFLLKDRIILFMEKSLEPFISLGFYFCVCMYAFKVCVVFFVGGGRGDGTD